MSRHRYWWGSVLLWGMACKEEAGETSKSVDTNGYAGDGPALLCPMEMSDDPGELGVEVPSIDAAMALELARSAVPPVELVWRIHPEDTATTSGVSWAVELGEPILLSVLADRSTPTSPICPAGPSWFVPATIFAELDNQIEFSLLSGVQVFDDGATSDEVRFAAAKSAPLAIPVSLRDAVYQEPFVWNDSVFEASVWGTVEQPRVEVSAMASRASGVLWRSESDETVPCHSDYGYPCGTE